MPDHKRCQRPDDFRLPGLRPSRIGQVATPCSAINDVSDAMLTPRFGAHEY
jgi:hypothetical protein